MRKSLSIVCASLLMSSAVYAAGPIQTQNSLCLDVKDGGSTNGASVQIWKCAQNNTNQQWSVDNGQVRNANGKCLDVKDGVLANGGALQLWDCVSGSRNQAWTLANGALKLTGSNLCVDVTNGQFNNGTTLQLWSCTQGSPNQAWGQSAPSSQSGSNPSKYLQTSGKHIVDAGNRQVQLRGTNIGGWLVTEGWMNGYQDGSDKDPFRFSLETLERRFGAQTAADLQRTWQDNFFTTWDLDFIKSLGINAIRVPFGFRNLQHADGSWIKDSSGNIDFSRLDWIVGEAANRGIYTILDFHIWEGQQADYNLISENSDGGRAAQAKAAAIWTQVARHFKGNANIAAFDAINEPTGSYANLLQDALYKAIRASDADRIIVFESTSADPAPLNWKQVVYSIHMYDMMGQDYGANRNTFQKDLQGSIASFGRLNVPTYIGEFMVQKEGDMLSWLLGQYNANGLHWTNWAYKTVDLGAWGICNLPGSVKVDILHDSASTIKSHWQNLGRCTPETAVVNAFKSNLN